MVTQPTIGAPEMLLSTKLYIPSPRPDGQRVLRPRLVERLNAGLHRKLTLVSAPAGFGKTTLVGEWVHQLRSDAAQGTQVAWLSLDENDNDPARFLTYLVAALRTVEAGIAKGALSALQSPRPPPAEVILIPLINDMAAIPGRTVLVLDDYHLIEAQPVHDAITFLLRHLPPCPGPGRQCQGMHMVIATREDPLLPLARLRARGQLSELRAADLRFTSSEAVVFFNQVMGLDLSTQEIAALETHTEGWIAGLQLAAISMQGRQDVTGFVESFSGGHHFVLDYLVEEVLEQQPEPVQAFLLQSSILSRLTGSLCDALTGDDSGQVTLDMLEHANLFIVPLDDERRWYRYHHLFADLLQLRLEVTYPDRIHDLHTKAAIWYEENGDLPQAIHHAFAADDIQAATRLIEKGALDALERSDFGFIFRSVDLLPDTALQSAPRLFIYHAWALVLTGQIARAGPRLEHTEWLLDAMSDHDEAERQEMRAYIAGVKTHLAAWQRDYPHMFSLADQAMEGLPKDHWVRAYCAMSMGVAFWGYGDLAAATAAFTEAAAIGRATGNRRVAVASALYLGDTLEAEGHLQQAIELFEDSLQALERDGTESPLSGYLHVEVGRLYYEMGELDRASQHLREGINQCQLLSDGRVEQIGRRFLVRLCLARGDLTGALRALRHAERAHHGVAPSVDMRGGEYAQVRLWLEQNKLSEVRTWLEQSGADPDDTDHFKTKLTYTMHARALVALARECPEGTHLDEALRLLGKLLHLAEDNSWGAKVIEILALQALALQEKGDNARAMAALERALTLAEPESFARIFVDEGPPMAALLYEALSRGTTPDYVRRLLAAFPVPEPEAATPSVVHRPSSALVEPLSERELEVLQLIAEGLTNQEIASRLFLSLNTVKAHTRNIYGKLDVHNRTEAAARARTLGLISST
jgi:LuxR family maltose regulon positive regulatory protein